MGARMPLSCCYMSSFAAFVAVFWPTRSALYNLITSSNEAAPLRSNW